MDYRMTFAHAFEMRLIAFETSCRASYELINVGLSAASDALGR
jgi:hypothetical protein